LKTRIAVLGAKGLIGSSLCSRLSGDFDVQGFSRKDADFNDLSQTIKVLSRFKPTILINAVGKVGGVSANLETPVQLLLGNTRPSLNILEAAHEVDIPRFFQFGAACMYPINENHALKETDLGTGSVEFTSRSYAYAKILQHEALLAYRSQHNRSSWTTLIPTNIFGIGDWTHGDRGHFISMMTEKIIRARNLGEPEVEVWGDGSALRDFISVEDLTSAVKFLIQNGTGGASALNISGYGEITILNVAQKIKLLLNYNGSLVLNPDKPAGAKRKVLDSSMMTGLHWTCSNELGAALQSYLHAAEEHYSQLT
jgi:GDP-L-fucose synthase